MDSDNTHDRYRSVCRYLCIGDREYAVLDPELARQRAIHYFTQALSLIESDPNQKQQGQVNELLILATDFGSQDAPYIMALRVLDNEIKTPYAHEDVVVFLKLAAERGHPEASMQMGSCYAAMNKFPRIEACARDYFASFTEAERKHLAEYYFNKAVEKNYQSAIEELIIAYGYGRGYIEKNATKFMALCSAQVAKGNQSVTLGYGAWLAGMTVEGKDPLPDVVKIPADPNRALEYLLKACGGKNLQMGRHSLKLICCGIERGIWKNVDKILRQLCKVAKNGNQLLSLYLAWYSIPEEHRCHMPQVFQDYDLPLLADIVPVDRQAAITYLDSAFFGADEDISEVAKEILSQVFGRCFMDADGMLVLESEVQ